MLRSKETVGEDRCGGAGGDEEKSEDRDDCVETVDASGDAGSRWYICLMDALAVEIIELAGVLVGGVCSNGELFELDLSHAALDVLEVHPQLI
jgi:hypothetical protein